MAHDNIRTLDELLTNPDLYSLYAPEVLTPRKDISLDPAPMMDTTPPELREFRAVSFDDKGRAMFDKREVVRWLKACHIVFDGDIPYRYNGAIYERITNEDIADHIYRELEIIPEAPFQSRSAIADIIANFKAVSQAKGLAPPPYWEESEDYNGELIVFSNGIYNLTTDELLPFTPYYFITAQLAVRYDPSITESRAEKCLAKILPDEHTRDFFLQLSGYTLFSQTLDPPGLFCIYGPGGTGKSGLDKMMRATMGDSNISNLKPHQLSKDFLVSDIRDKMLNISGETGKGQRTVINDVDGELLKQLSDGQLIQVDRKHKSSITFPNRAKLWFVTNQLPDFGDSSSGMLRRVFIIPCRHQQNWDDQLHTHMTTPEACSWFANKALHAYREFLARGRRFYISELMKRELLSYKVQDGLGEYLLAKFGTLDKAELTENLDGVMVDEIYREYSEYVKEGGGKPLARKSMSERLRNEYGLESKIVRAVQESGRPTNRVMLIRCRA